MKPTLYALAITFIFIASVSANETHEAYEYGYIHKHKEGSIGPDNYWHPHMYEYEHGLPPTDATEWRRAFEARRDATQREHDLYIEMMQLELEQNRHNAYELDLLELILENSTEY